MKCDFARRPAHGIVAPVWAVMRDGPVEERSKRLPTAAEIAEINARHLISTPLKPADLLFVFRTREDVVRRVDQAFRLWREGFFRWSIVSGGVAPGSRLSECRITPGAMGAGRPSPEQLRAERPPSHTGANL